MLVMRIIRAEVRRQRPADLSVTQLRALAFVFRRPGSSLLDMSGHLGLGAPTVSKMVDALTGRGFMVQRVAAADRRRRMLRLTPRGTSQMRRAFRATRDHLGRLLVTLSSADRAGITRAMLALRPAVAVEALRPAAPARRPRAARRAPVSTRRARA